MKSPCKGAWLTVETFTRLKFLGNEPRKGLIGFSSKASRLRFASGVLRKTFARLDLLYKGWIL